MKQLFSISLFLFGLCLSQTSAVFSGENYIFEPTVDIVCDGEYFTGKCPEGEVMEFQYAMFGRMELNRCTKRNVEIGCFTGALSVVEHICGGRQKCVLAVENIAYFLGEKPCHDYSSYLEVSYTCV